MDYGFFRAAAASVDLKVADPAFNAEQTITAASQAEAKDAKLVVFPELCVTGYTCGDLFFQESLLDAALRQTERIAKETSGLNMIIAVGLPVKKDGALYNAAAVLFKGKILALVPKTFIQSFTSAAILVLQALLQKTRPFIFLTKIPPSPSALTFWFAPKARPPKSPLRFAKTCGRQIRLPQATP